MNFNDGWEEKELEKLAGEADQASQMCMVGNSSSNGTVIIVSIARIPDTVWVSWNTGGCRVWKAITSFAFMTRFMCSWNTTHR